MHVSNCCYPKGIQGCLSHFEFGRDTFTTFSFNRTSLWILGVSISSYSGMVFAMYTGLKNLLTDGSDAYFGVYFLYIFVVMIFNSLFNQSIPGSFILQKN